MPEPVVTSLSAEELGRFLGLPAWRGRQIKAWLWRGATTFEEMTDLPVTLREELPGRIPVLSSRVVEKIRSRDGTRKILLSMSDGALVESVLIPEGERLTLCISSQVGCAVRCAFCASGLLGFTRNLETHEIMEQLLHAARIAGGQKKLTNIVMMGMGEPLHNFDHVVTALRLFPYSARKITLSTVGLPDRIRKLAAEGLQVNLAVSLHAPDDETRNRLVPLNRQFGIRSVVQAARDYFTVTGRDVTFEYILIEGVNAGLQHAEALAHLLGRGHLNVNLIPMNPVEGLPWRPPAKEQVDAFLQHLVQAGIPTHLRRPRGGEIDAACGQLRLRRLRKSNP